MASNEPIYVTFEFQGNLDKEVEKLTLGIAGLGDESAKTYKRLLSDSNEAFQGLSKQNQQLAISIQEDINSLRQLGAIQDAVNQTYAEGKMTTQQYTVEQAQLANQERELKTAIASGMAELQTRIAMEGKAQDSMNSLMQKLRQLTEQYYNLSKADRNGAAGQSLLTQIKDVDAQVHSAQTQLSAYSRTAGTGFNSLNMSVQQVARELPSLTMGANMFFLAISNNLPILADNIKKARIEYDALKASGQKATPVWKQMIGSILSWQTAMVVGITLLTVYGKEVVNFISNIFKTTSATDRARIAQENYNAAKQEGIKNAQEELAKLELLCNAINNTNKSYSERLSAARQMKALYPDHLKNLSDEKILTSDLGSLYLELQKNILKAAFSKASFDKIVENNKKINDLKDGLQDSINPDKGFWGWADKNVPYLSKNITVLGLRMFHLGEKAKNTANEIKALEDANKKLANGIDVSDFESTPENKEETGPLGSIKYYESVISKLKEAYSVSISDKQRDALKKQIEKYSEKLAKLTEETAPLGSIEYYESVIKKLKEAYSLASNDKERATIQVDIDKTTSEMTRIADNVGMVAIKAASDILEGIEIKSSARLKQIEIDRQNKERTELFGEFDTSDLKKLQEQTSRITVETKKAREGLLGIIDQWEILSDSDKAGLIGQECYKIADGMAYASECAELFNSELASTFNTISQLVGSVGDIASGVGRAMSGDVVGGAASVLSGVTNIIGTLKKNVQENKKILNDYLQSLLVTEMKEFEYNEILRERLRIQQQIGETTLAYFSRLQSELILQSGQIASDYDKLWKKLMGEEYISKTNYKHGTWFRKAKTWNDYESLAGKSYEDIEKLYTEDKLTESAKIIFEQLKKLKEEGKDVADMINDLNQEMREAWTGTTSNAIADTILKGFAEGKRSAADFADSFQEMLNNAVLQGIKIKALEEPLARWYESFAESSKGGLTTDKIADLKAQYDKVIADAAKQLEDAEKITGISITGTDAVRTAASKGIASMNQDGANELNGNFSALLVYESKTCESVQNINNLLIKGLEYQERIARNTDRLEAIESDMRQTRQAIQNMDNKGLILRK